MKFENLILAGVAATPLLCLCGFIGAWTVSSHRNEFALKKARAMCGNGPKVTIHDKKMWQTLLSNSRLSKQLREKIDRQYDPRFSFHKYSFNIAHGRIILTKMDYMVNNRKILTLDNVSVSYMYPVSFHWITPGFSEYNCLMDTPSDIRRVSLGY
jgi:hypothetical protein